MSDEEVRRSLCDGAVEVSRGEPGFLTVAVEHQGRRQHIQMTEWNARRVLGGLSVILGLPLSAAASKKVQM